MPLLRKGVLIPVEGLDYTKPSELINDRAGFPQNVRFSRNELYKREGITKYGSVAIADATQIMGLGKLVMKSGDQYLIRASKAKIEVFNPGSETWSSISITDLTGGDSDIINFAVVPESDFVVFTNYIDKPRKWTGSGNNTALGGNPPYAKYLTYLSPYLLFAYVYDGNAYPWRVQWCDTGQPEIWTGGNSGAEELSDEPSAIQNIIKLNEYAAVYKKESLWIGRKVFTSDVFQFDCIKTGIGLSTPRAIADADGRHYFMSMNNFYVWNGIREEAIGEPVRDEVFTRLDYDKLNRCFAIHIKNLNEVWFYIVINGQSLPTEVWKYNYRTGFWYFDTCNQLTAAITWTKTASSTWNEQVGSYDAALIRWDDSVQTKAWEEVVFGRNDGHTLRLDYLSANDDGSAVSAWFASKDFIGRGLEFKSRWLQLDVWARGTNGGKLYVDYSVDRGDTWVNIPYSSTSNSIPLTSLNTKYEMYLDVVSDYIRFRFRNAESSEVFYLRNFYPYYLDKEQIRS